ncbi:glutamate synthase small subunit [Pontibacillus yanchengensis]|uniref:Glutamate synthase small subunit n=2 Tax=Pontibacillus yanchengensis TaxID=462910 RepID=A0ACC7VCC2_9BACI|nr:glutamate synthase subunit beta [Pontibacillus yanchengensis]MYL32900.1 glutamate synthase small subunit [Pontibacillus yanchengensis]MYL51809.1 glutamate synthase small subunit [Pontibacillus yanchengensis]
MGKSTGFMEYEREESVERSTHSRVKDWNEYTAPFSDETLKRQGARCMDCGIPFCHTGIEINGQASGCPINNLIPEWNDLVYRGKWQEALERLEKTNNFPEFTGRVCPAPCEGACTVAISDPAVAIKNIEKAIIDKGFENGWIQPRIPQKRTEKKIAIVGSGPAGLASADELNQAGHSVTIFERSNRPGGLLMYGIPNMKLEKDIVERRINLLRQEGIDFITNTEVGKDISPEELQEQYDSVILCTGAQKQRDLSIEGRDAKGIHLAMDYLTASTKNLLDEDMQKDEYINVEGKDVIVIGGGDTGADCVATALRQDCNSVVQFGKHPKQPTTRPEDNMWPEPPNVFTLEYAYKEAAETKGEDPRQYSIQTTKFVADENGHLQELHTVQTEKVWDDKGFYSYREIPGTEMVWPVQHVMIAIGFEGPEQPLLKHFGVDTTSRGCVDAEYGNYTTNLEGVFAAGDARRGQSLIVWAINEGREVAREVDQYLMGSTVLPG